MKEKKIEKVEVKRGFILIKKRKTKPVALRINPIYVRGFSSDYEI